MTKPGSNTIHIAVQQFLSDTKIDEETRMLVGVSGGIDSMVLLNSLYELGYNISVGHINFNLRGAESDQDAVFVGDWCKQRNIPFYILNKITKTVEAALGINTQTAARKIRYEWWDRLSVKHKFAYVLTAHHLNDSIETLLLNLFRGSGMKGLRGIPAIRGIYIRPLLEISKTAIEDYARKFDIPYRTDSSNLTDHYQRNRLRHHIIPILQEMYPGLHSSMGKTFSRLNTEWNTLDAQYAIWVAKNIKPESGGIKMEAEKDTTSFTLRWLEEKGFPWQLTSDFILSIKQDTGHYLEHNDHRLSRTDFGYFLEDIKPSTHITIDQPGKYVDDAFEIVVEPIADNSEMHFDDPLTVYVNSSVIKWPLTIRSIAPGDIFQPFGMGGKRKKIQDLMVDLKLEIFEKKRLLILENEDHIIWVIGKRLDERASVKETDSPIIRLQYRTK